MQNSRQRAFFVLGTVALAAFCVLTVRANLAHAQSAPFGAAITAQNSAEATSTAIASVQTQGVGNSLTGTLTYVEVQGKYGPASGSGFNPGTSGVLVQIFDCTTDSTYASCSKVATTTRQSISVATAGQTFDIYLPVFSTTGPGLILTSSHYYKWNVDETATYTGALTMTGTALTPVYVPSTTHGQQLLGTSGGLQALYYDWIQTFTNASGTIAVATTSSLFSGQTATDTLSALAGQCSQTGNVFAEGICIGASFLFVPSNDAVNSILSVPGNAAARFPFSWIYGAQTLVAGLTASSTANFITIQYDFSQIPSATSTTADGLSLASILPHMTALSTSTILTYMSQNTWDTFQLFLKYSLWLSFMVYVVYFARDKMFHNSSAV